MKSKTEITDWLRSQGIINKVYLNFALFKPSPTPFSLCEVLETMQENALMIMFDWELTSEGYSFWDSIDNEFRKFYKI